MGQKIHPGGLRVGIIHRWKSNWYTGKKEFPAYLLEDVKIREHIYKKLAHAGLSDILIQKDKQRITVDIYTARPGIVIGKSGVEVDALRRELHALTQKNVHININEIKRPELDAKLVAQSIAEQLSNRVAFRLGEQDTRRRRGGAVEGLGASRESGRGRGPDREGLGPVRPGRRRGPGGGGGGGGRPGQRRGPGAGARPAGGGGGGRPRRDQQPQTPPQQQAPTPAAEETPKPVNEAPPAEAATPETPAAPSVSDTESVSDTAKPDTAKPKPKRAPRKKPEGS